MIITIFMVMGAAKTSAQTMMNLEDIDYYLENLFPYSILYTEELHGTENGEDGSWKAPVNRSLLPTMDFSAPILDENGYIIDMSPSYGMAVFINDENDDHTYFYDLGNQFWFSPHNNGSLDYDGTGIYQILQDPIYGEDEIPDPEEFISGAYFFSSDLDLYHTIRVIIYWVP